MCIGLPHKWLSEEMLIRMCVRGRGEGWEKEGREIRQVETAGMFSGEG